jgi:hypothetical protein
MSLLGGLLPQGSFPIELPSWYLFALYRLVLESSIYVNAMLCCLVHLQLNISDYYADDFLELKLSPPQMYCTCLLCCDAATKFNQA